MDWLLVRQGAVAAAGTLSRLGSTRHRLQHSLLAASASSASGKHTAHQTSLLPHLRQISPNIHTAGSMFGHIIHTDSSLP